MDDDTAADQLQLLRALTGTWTTEGSHPLLPDADIRGRSTFEWLDGGRFLIWRAHYDHPDIPDAVSVIGAADGRLAMHYFDARGVQRTYTVDRVADGTIECPCHGSRFDAATGAVRHGPATRPLAPVPVAVRSGEVVTA